MSYAWVRLDFQFYRGDTGAQPCPISRWACGLDFQFYRGDTARALFAMKIVQKQATFNSIAEIRGWQGTPLGAGPHLNYLSILSRRYQPLAQPSLSTSLSPLSLSILSRRYYVVAKGMYAVITDVFITFNSIAEIPHAV